VKIDELALKYFDNPKDFGEGMTLLYKLAEKRVHNNLEYPVYEELLNLGMDENEGGADNTIFDVWSGLNKESY